MSIPMCLRPVVDDIPMSHCLTVAKEVQQRKRVGAGPKDAGAATVLKRGVWMEMKVYSTYSTNCSDCSG